MPSRWRRIRAARLTKAGMPHRWVQASHLRSSVTPVSSPHDGPFRRIAKVRRGQSAPHFGVRGQAVGVASPSPRYGSLFRLVRLSVFLEDVGSCQGVSVLGTARGRTCSADLLLPAGVANEPTETMPQQPALQISLQRPLHERGQGAALCLSLLQKPEQPELRRRRPSKRSAHGRG